MDADLEAAAGIGGGAVHPSSAVGKRDVAGLIDSDEAAVSGFQDLMDQRVAGTLKRFTRQHHAGGH